jgi:hypothetical protein
LILFDHFVAAFAFRAVSGFSIIIIAVVTDAFAVAFDFIFSAFVCVFRFASTVSIIFIIIGAAALILFDHFVAAFAFRAAPGISIISVGVVACAAVAQKDFFSVARNIILIAIAASHDK